MVAISRFIDKSLNEWKASSDHKPLLLRGARQVGKTFSVRQLASSFDSFVEVNFLEHPQVSNFFQGTSLAPVGLIEKLGGYFGKAIVPGRTLLFFDEVQACPEALSALRFFYEQMPELHIVVTGSLLEFALAEIPSFGVGRIASLFMYPVSVSEFFAAIGNSPLLEIINQADTLRPLDPVLHRKAVDLLRTYLIIGGLPEVVSSYIERRDIPYCLSQIEALILSYEDDFSKYKERVNVSRLRAVWRACARQAGRKFVYAHVNPGASTYGYGEALELIERAGLVYRVQHSAANGIPLGAEINPEKFKVIPFDVGVYNRLLGLDVSQLLVDDEVKLINSGALAEVLCGLELIAGSRPTRRPELYYWSREARSSNAEVDYLVQRENQIIPIEVKAGTKGQMQSMYRFLAEKNRASGIRVSLENFGQLSHADYTIKIVPLYSVDRLGSNG